MQLRNTTQSYGIIAQAFHWTVALLVFVQLGLGLHAADLPVSIARLRWLSWHKSLGITILALVVLRLAWRMFNPPPALPATMPRWERASARVTHAMIYLLLIAAPLAGWLHASAAGLSASWFGLVRIPDLVDKNSALAQTFGDVHALLVGTLAALLVLHIAAASRHWVLLQDGVMERMLPRRRKEKE